MLYTYSKWQISIRTNTQRRDIFMESREDETPQETYRRVKERADRIRKKVGGQAIVEIISRTIPFKPRGYRPFNTWYWCPYCMAWRVFVNDDYIGRRRCPICGITEEDFYVKNYNHLWDWGSGKLRDTARQL